MQYSLWYVVPNKLPVGNLVTDELRSFVTNSCCGSGESGSEMCALWRGSNILYTVHTSLYPLQLQPGQNTIGSDTQFCCPDDGRKDARNMLRSNWLPTNLYLLHLVGLTFICLYQMHGHSDIKFVPSLLLSLWLLLIIRTFIFTLNVLSFWCVVSLLM